MGSHISQQELDELYSGMTREGLIRGIVINAVAITMGLIFYTLNNY